MSSEPDPEKKIVVDTDWKEQVRQEKAKQQAAAATPDSPEPSPASEERPGSEPESAAQAEPQQASRPSGRVPRPDFNMLVSMLATQAFAALGQIPDPASGQRHQQPEAAQYLIDLLAVLEEKTKGNLTTDEHTMLDGVLHDLRMAYVAVVKGQ